MSYVKPKLVWVKLLFFFVLTTLEQLEMVENQVYVLVVCHTRELAFHIYKEYECFSKYMTTVKVGVFVGGVNIHKDEQTLKPNCPHIVVGTPGLITTLVRSKRLNLRTSFLRNVTNCFEICICYEMCRRFSATHLMKNK